MQHPAHSIAEVLIWRTKEKEKVCMAQFIFPQKRRSEMKTQAEGKIRLVLKADNDSLYYEGDFEDMDFYKEALLHLKRLKTYFPIKRGLQKKSNDN